MNPKKLAFTVLCVSLSLLVLGYGYRASVRHTAGPVVVKTEVPESVDLPVVETPQQAPAQTPNAGPERKDSRIFFRYNATTSADYGKLFFMPVVSRAKAQMAGGRSCEVAYAGGGRGICLIADRGVLTTYIAELFDATTFGTIGRIPLQGPPSRCRVSHDGRLAAATVFVTGHSYASLDFSTQTLLIDAQNAKVIADLETFAVVRDGMPFKNTDFNFWGVTFTPDNKNFYCTLSSQGKHYLVKGNIAARTATVIHENVECPSLSPGASRIAYKKRFQENGRVLWQLHVLDLATLKETALQEKRSVDDQLEWLDDRRVLYALPEGEMSASTNIWVAGADATSVPKLFLKNAYSPSVER